MAIFFWLLVGSAIIVAAAAFSPAYAERTRVRRTTRAGARGSQDRAGRG